MPNNPARTLVTLLLCGGVAFAACPTPEKTTPIPAIQGNTAQSPLKDQKVTTRGVVTGIFEGRLKFNGFFIQDKEGDNDPATSDGLFVFQLGALDLKIGDEVQVTGTVKEYLNPKARGKDTETSIELPSEVTVCSSGNTLAPTPVILPRNSWEALEGMLLSFPQKLTITDLYRLERYGEMGLAAEGRQFVPTNGNTTRTKQQNLELRIVLGDGASEEYPSPVPFMQDYIRLGDTVDGVTGVLRYDLDTYKVEPVKAPTITRTSPRPEKPPFVAGNVKIASMNVLNYFTTLEMRGATDEIELERQRKKLIATMVGLQTDVITLMEIENNVPTEDPKAPKDPLQDLTDSLNEALGGKVYGSIKTPKLGSDDIRVAYLYRLDTIAPVGTFKIDSSNVFERPPLAQTFSRKGSKETFTVVGIHFKSKGSCGNTDTDTGQGCWNQRRTEQSKQLLNFVNTLSTPNVVLVGDFNAYGAEDPVKVIKEAGYQSAEERLPEPERYSYSFAGESGSLDHIFVAPSLQSKIYGVGIWHINSDESQYLDYRQKILDLYTPTPFRSSDHDPIILGLQLN